MWRGTGKPDSGRPKAGGSGAESGGLPKGHGGGQVAASRDLLHLLQQSEKEAGKRGDEFVASEMFLVALADSKTDIGGIVRGHGLTRKSFEAAIDAVRGGAANPLEGEGRTSVGGGDLLPGRPGGCEVTGGQIGEAIDPSVQQIVDAVKDTIEETPPELVADIMDQGIYLAGGGALLRGMDTRISEATQLAVHIADDPLTCVARGTGKVLEDLVKYDRSLVTDTYAIMPR